MKVENCKMGKKVYFQGEPWEIGFINRRSFAGTVRLQKSGDCKAKQVNNISPEDLEEHNTIKWINFNAPGGAKGERDVSKL